jgi:DNA-binding FadR family transcriptional regulator
VTRRMTVASTFERVLDSIGLAIVRGELPAGHVDTIEGLIARTAASRSIVREASRVLASLGMIRAERRVGLTILGRDEWQLLDPIIIRWREASADRAEQENELRDLRRAVEGEAAKLAATRRSIADMKVLNRALSDLDAAAQARDSSRFLIADQQLHTAILTASGSRLLMRLQTVVDEALRLRTPTNSAAWRAARSDVRLHRELVTAIERQNPDASGDIMVQIAQG